MGGGISRLVELEMQRDEKRKSNDLSDKILLSFSLLLIISLNVIKGDSDSAFFSSVVWLIPSSIIVYHIFKIENKGYKSMLFGHRIMVFLGNISFYFFICHQLIIRYLDAILYRITSNYGLLILVFSVVLSIAASTIFLKMEMSTKKDKGRCKI